MIRLIALLILYTHLGSAQSPVIKLTYEQRVTKKSTGEKFPGEAHGILNSFQPLLLSFVESSMDLKKVVFVEKDKIYIENYLSNQKGMFSAKIEEGGETYYLNELTAEKKIFDSQKFDFLNIGKPTKFKSKKRKSNKLQNSEIFIAENENMLLEYHVSTQLAFKMNSNLSEEFLYDNNVILKSIKYIKKEDKEIVNILISIDTLENEDLKVYTNKLQKRNLQALNLNIDSDSIDYNEIIPDIYINQIGKADIISLNQYKANGKYLMIDFWGTWCKPCLAAIPKLKSFYEEYSDQMDLIALNYNDPNETRVKDKIEQYEMNWDHGSVSEKVLKILNPNVEFPGILLFDDEMRLIVRGDSKSALIKARNILEK